MYFTIHRYFKCLIFIYGNLYLIIINILSLIAYEIYIILRIRKIFNKILDFYIFFYIIFKLMQLYLIIEICIYGDMHRY